MARPWFARVGHAGAAIISFAATKGIAPAGGRSGARGQLGEGRRPDLARARARARVASRARGSACVRIFMGHTCTCIILYMRHAHARTSDAPRRTVRARARRDGA